ncbi:hypothetical protein Ciccas_012697, partial [Cichlidogyrus casuarinus]
MNTSSAVEWEGLTADDCIKKMFNVARDGRLEILQDLVKQNPRYAAIIKDNINHLDDQELGLLHYSARNYNLNCLRYFIDQLGADPHLEGRNRCTPLHMVSKVSNVNEIGLAPAVETNESNLINDDESFKEFLGNVLEPATLALLSQENIRSRRFHPVVHYLVSIPNLNVNIQDSNGMTPLHYYALRGYELATLQLLVSNKGIVNNVKDRDGLTPLALAVTHNHISIVKLLLLYAKADRVSDDNYGMIGLHRAVLANNIECVKLLLEKRPERQLENKDKANRTPLHLAIRDGHLEMARYLIDRGASLTVRTGELDSLLHLAVRSDEKDMVLMLLNSIEGAQSRFLLDCENANEQTPLHVSALSDTPTVAQLLIDFGAYRDVRDMNHRTPIMLAAMENSLAVLQVLLENHVSVVCFDKYFKSTLFLAVENNCIEAVEMLLKYGHANLVHRGDLTGNTPLLIAASSGRIEIMDMLIKSGAL